MDARSIPRFFLNIDGTPSRSSVPLQALAFLSPSSNRSYLAFNVGKQYLGLSIPTWIIVVTTLLARPALTFARNQYTDLQDRRAAAALGAVLAPHVPESAIAVARKVLGSLTIFQVCHQPSSYLDYTPYIFPFEGDLSWLDGQKYGYFHCFSIHKPYGESINSALNSSLVVLKRSSDRYL
jgi:hypothetical protein